MSEQNQFAIQVAQRAMQIINEQCVPQARQDEAEPITILLALSGGVDSTALLLSMCSLRTKFSFRLHAAHFNHCLRGAESEQDAEYCRNLTKTHDVPLHCQKDLAVLESTSERERAQLASENSLRDRRYQFLEETAVSIGASFIFTGHTLDDQAETVLFRLFRGTSLTGATGIQEARRLASGVWVVRPMLSSSRSNIESYVSAHGIVARQDSSNEDVSYTRNFIRHELMPLILSRFPSALERIENFTGLARIDDRYLDLAARSVFSENFLHEDEWNIDWLSALPRALLNRVITLALHQRRIEPASELIQEIAELVSPKHEHASRDARFSIDKVWDIQRSANQIRWLDKTPVSAPASFDFKVRVPGTTVIPALGKALHIEQCYDPEERLKFMTEFGFQVRVDLSKSEPPLVLRRRQAGDVIQPFGMDNMVSLKKYLHTHKARRFAGICCERLDKSWSVQNCIVLASGPEIFWIPGVGISEKLRVRSTASYVLRFLPLAPDTSTFC